MQVQRISRGETITDATARSLEMAVVRGADEPEDEPTNEERPDGVCDLYEPGAWDTVACKTTHASVWVRLCKTCGGVEGDHEEPSDSKRRTIVPPGPEPVAAAPTPEQLAAEAARIKVDQLMGGPYTEWFDQLLVFAALNFGRPPNQYEVNALLSYVCGASLSTLKRVVGL